jgi:hypothetical protein
VVGFWLAHLPGVADFVSKYIDIVLAGIVIVSIAPIIFRALASRRKVAGLSWKASAGSPVEDEPAE